VTFRRRLLACLAFAGLAAASGMGMSLASPSPLEAAPGPVSASAPASVRRLNEQQYVRSIHDIFGPGINVPGRFEPSVRDGGLLAIGDSKVAISSSGFEQYELRAREIAAQVLAEPQRKTSMPCTPASARAFDAACAERFVGQYGRLLYRRPLSEAEKASALRVAEAATKASDDFYKGLQVALSRLLVSPNFIFRVEDVERDPDNAGAWRLTDYALASRVSFLLWDAPPDAALLDAVASGAFRKPGGLETQVDRMLAAPRFEAGVRAFFSDMFGYEQFDAVSKDQNIFPMYTSQLAKDAREQALRTIVQLLVTDKGDYRDLFTTRKTFMNRSLGGLYDVPVSAAAVDGWAPYTFGEDDNRAGLLTLAGFLMLDVTHEGRTSPTIRGKSVRELLLCQPVPQPPGNVNFALVQDTHNPLFKTARGRLTAHRDNPVCAGCHAITDPMGLSMENYDAVGRYRGQENGAPIDASGTFEGKPYRNVIEFEQLLRASPSVPQCAVQRVYEYGVGRALAAGDNAAMEELSQRFASARYVFPALMRAVATSRAFRAAPMPTLAAN
jgi:hypothetical protein